MLEMSPDQGRFGPQLDRDRLYEELRPLVRRLVQRYGGSDEQLRQDLTVECYLRFSLLLAEYDPARGVPLKPYLVRKLTAAMYTYARAQWITRYREISFNPHSKETGAALFDGSAGSPAGGFLGRCSKFQLIRDPTDEWTDDLVRRDLIRDLPAMIDALAGRQREAVQLRYFEDRSFDEIAAALGVKNATARSLVRHALNRLRCEVMRRSTR